MGSGIRNVSNPDGGSSLVNLRVALLEVTLKPSAKFSFFDSRFFRNGSMLIEQISATSITCDPWLLLNPWMWGKNLLSWFIIYNDHMLLIVCNSSVGHVWTFQGIQPHPMVHPPFVRQGRSRPSCRRIFRRSRSRLSFKHALASWKFHPVVSWIVSWCPPLIYKRGPPPSFTLNRLKATIKLVCM